MVGAAGLLAWMNYHTEVTFADGLRGIQQAEAIDRGAWTEGVIRSVDHPLHPLAIAAVHRLIGGAGPGVAGSVPRRGPRSPVLVLLVIPVYLLTLEIFGPSTAWLGCLLAIANPVLGHVVINVLSETTFLLFWTWGLWAAVRFLREGRFVWLPLTIGFGALAYLARPEGMLLPLALVATLAAAAAAPGDPDLLAPLVGGGRRSWSSGSLLPGGSVHGDQGGDRHPAGDRAADRHGAPGRRPALEREHPLPPDQTAFETYRLAIRRVGPCVPRRGDLPLLAAGGARPGGGAAVDGAGADLAVRGDDHRRCRSWRWSGSTSTGGYCTVRHALVPALLFWLAAAHGLAWLTCSIVIDGRWLGMAEGRFRPGPAALGRWPWLALVGIPLLQATTRVPGSFGSYRDAGRGSRW